MSPFDYQIAIADKAFEILRNYGIAYLAMEERTGKTLTSILIAEKSDKVESVFIVTKKKAIEGWRQTLCDFKHTKQYYFINYESLHKVQGKFDLAIVDEAHYAISSYPRPSKSCKLLQKITYNLPVIFLSATPSAESYSQLFHTLAITKFSPFNNYANFYRWFDKYGIHKTRFLAGRTIIEYKETREDLVKQAVQHLFISYTRKELGFEKEPVDAALFVELSNYTKSLMLEAKRDGVVRIAGEQHFLENTSAEMQTLQQLEGGTLKLKDGRAIETGQTEKIDYIKKSVKDLSKVVVMYRYVAEKALLEKHLKGALILQCDAFAEGVDLSNYETLIIYSMSFSASKYIQRRARQCNKNRKDDIKVFYLLCKDCISEMMYEAIVKSKLSFTESYYKNIRNN